MIKKQKLVVIGNGMAGARVVEEILQRSPDAFEITMLGAEPYGNYNRILLSNVLNGLQQASDIFINPLAWYKKNGVTLHAGVKALRIDRVRHVVIGQVLSREAVPYAAVDEAKGELVEVPYDKVIIATGSRPFVPPIDGFTGAGGFLFRTLDESARIADYAKSCAKAVVIGGGLLGLEAARGLMTHGVQVTVIEAAPWLMKLQLDAEAGQVLQSTMEAMGVSVLCGKISQQIVRHDGRIKKILFQDGSEIETDMVVISTGIRPITEIAKASGLDVGRGITCNDQMQTSDSLIFALGECVEHRGQIYGLVEPIWEQARVLADSLSQKNPDARYLGSGKSCTKLKVMGVELISMGETMPASPQDEVINYVEPSRGVYKKMIIRNGKLVGVILLGETDTAGVLTQYFVGETLVPERRADLLFGSATGAPILSVFDLPDHAQICNCNGVTKGQIKEAILVGKCKSVSKIGACTKAGAGCGSCKKLITQFLEVYAGEAVDDPFENRYVPGVAMAKPELVAAIKEKNLKSVSAVFKALADGKEQAESKAGLASLLRSIWHGEYDDERDARFINDRVHANIQKNGTFSVIPRIYGGVTTADELIRIGDVAKKYDVPMVKITGGQRIDLLGVKKEDLPKMWKDLGMPSGHAYTKSVRTVKSCVGTDFCRFGLGDAIKLAQEIEFLFQGIESPHKIKMAVAGCPRNCSEAYVKDVGVVAIEGGLWEIYVGGAAGATVRKGDLLITTSSHAETILHAGRFIQYYREQAKYLERTYDFVGRIGIDKLRSILIEDELGMAKRLDEEMKKAIAAYQDPWLEAELPVYPSQFEGPELVRVLEEAFNNG
jgi:nitrite reductase (NADH) large subunit